MLNVRELVADYSRSARSFAELLPWFGFVADDLIVNTDGSLMAGFRYSGLDIESVGEDARDALLDGVQNALQQLDERNIVWSFLDRECQKFADAEPISWNPVTEYVEQRLTEEFDNGGLAAFHHTIWVTYNGVKGATGFFDMVAHHASEGMNWGQALSAATRAFLSRKTALERAAQTLDGTIGAFQAQMAAFEAALDAIGIARLRGEEMAGELLRRATPASRQSRIKLPPRPYYLSTVLNADTMRRHDARTFVFDGVTRQRYVAALGVKSWPGLTEPAQIEMLATTGAEYTVVTVFRPLDQEVAKNTIQEAEQNYRAAAKSPVTRLAEKFFNFESDKVDQGQLLLAENAQEAATKVTSMGTRFGYLSMGVLVYGDSVEELEESVRVISTPLSHMQYAVTRESVNGVSAWSAFLPGQSAAMTRWLLANVENLTDLIPIRTIAVPPNENRHFTEQRQVHSRALCVLPTRYGTPHYLNLHVDDVGHFCVVGPTGAGKTTLMNLIIALWPRYNPAKVFVLDKNFSCKNTMTLLGGQYVDLRPGSAAAAKLNPMRLVRDPAMWPKLETWLEIIFTSFGYELTSDSANTIRYGIQQLAAYPDPRKHRLSVLKAELDGRDRDLAAELAPWVQGGRYGHLFDNEDDSFGDGSIVGVELGGLLDDERMAAPVTTYVMMSIDERITASDPTLVYLEEGWYLLRNPRFAAYYEDFLKTMRKRNAICGLSTQGVKDVRDAPIGATLINEIMTRIFLANEAAHNFKDVYQDTFGLTDDQVELIRTARRKADYMICQRGMSRIVSPALPPDVLAITRSDALAKAVFDKHCEAGGNGWEGRYIQELAQM